jgi:periplasmic divalent cation tolerance protein
MRIVIFVTCANKEEAKKIAKALVEAKESACVNIIDGIDSIFWWQGKTDMAKESLLIIKSKKSKLPRIIKRVKALHSYQVPEIIALPIIGGEKKYLRWIDESC